ncbi:MAG TPA: hypothetical protein VIH90_03795 [Candidatus Saccharimonadales bacterium]
MTKNCKPFEAMLDDHDEYLGNYGYIDIDARLIPNEPEAFDYFPEPTEPPLTDEDLIDSLCIHGLNVVIRYSVEEYSV